jgi:hypothetical protein
MKAFVSYSHPDSHWLDILHKHLANLQREGIIDAWTDQQIPAGGSLEQQIGAALRSSELFIALLSPDYIASNYCYTQEFKEALQRQEAGTIIIVPVIVEPCDWLNTPFSQFKAVPKDGKPVSTWENKNTAFLDVVQNLRKLISMGVVPGGGKTPNVPKSPTGMSRNYRVQKDFDSIEKMDFVEQTFQEVKELLKRYIDEITQMENVKVRTVKDTKTEMECILVNRNKIAAESQMRITTEKGNSGFSVMRSAEGQIGYSIGMGNQRTRNFSLSVDQYHLFWVDGNYYGSSGKAKELSARDMADLIWNEWLESVGIG